MKQERRNRNGRSALAFVLALVLTLPAFMPSSSYAVTKFKDTSGHWAEGFITRAYNQNVVNGYPDGKFYPNKSVTRAEFVSMVNSAFDINIDYDPADFSDITYDKWFYKAISIAETAAYLDSAGGKAFRPNTAITRQEAAVMLSNILPNYKGGGNLKSYRDYRLIATWATAAMEKMTGREYFGAYDDGRIHPTDPLTRAQAAKILCDILDNETIVTRVTTIDENDTTLSERIYTDDVIIDEDLAEGNATIDNCVILGKLYVEGGGSKSININNSRVASVVMDKDDTAVRLVTKGTTVIPKLTASQKSILQTAGKDGTGILNVTVNKNADVALKGNFPVINVVGQTSVVSLESGKISTLTVTGKYSDITLTGKAQVAQATVNVESYFHGEGVITHMNVNADNVTYETKPKKMTVGTAIDRATEEGSTDVDVTFKPKSKATDVDVDENITLTFVSSMKLADGKAIAAANIKDFVSLKAGSRSGDNVEFTASINSARKIITIDPVSDLSTSTKYYVILKDEALINSGGTKNEGTSAYFTTSSKGGATSATFSPANGATGVSTGTAISVKFKGDVVKYSDAGEVNAAYLQECIQLKSGGSSGSAVTFTGSISSADTITITPTGGLTAGQSYTVAVVANKLKTKDGGKTISASSATWTVASAVTVPTAATLTTLTVTPLGGSNALAGFSSSTSSYNVTVPFGTTSVAISATAASGTAVQINSVTTSSAVVPVTTGSATSISVSSAASGMTTTNYTISVTVAGNTALDQISIMGVYMSPNQDLFTSNLNLYQLVAFVLIYSADPSATISIEGITSQGVSNNLIDVAPGPQTITFTVTSNMTTKTYTIVFSRLDF